MKKIMNFKDFTEVFPDDAACLALLCDIKWKKGFTCQKCKCQDHVKGKTWYYRRCKSCHYNESCTANSMFHKIKIPIVRAFWIIYHLSSMKKGLSTYEIARLYGIHQTTAWFFKHKVQRAMSAECRDFIDFMNDYMKTNSHSMWSQENPDNEAYTNQESEDFKTQGQNRIAKTYTIDEIGKNRNPKMDKVLKKFGLDRKQIFVLKKWLAGTHHRVSENHLKWYLCEFYHRSKWEKQFGKKAKNVIFAFVKHRHLPYLEVIVT